MGTESRPQVLDPTLSALYQFSATVSESRCPECGAPSGCAMAAGKSSSACWCMGEPVRDTGDVDDDSACLCPQCFRAKPRVG